MVRNSVTGELGTIKKVTVTLPNKVPLEKGPINLKTQQEKDKNKSDAKQQQADQTQKTTQSTDDSGKTKGGQQTPPTKDVRTGGEPISLVTGEELLTLTDFELQGTVPMSWVRTYRSSNPDNIGLGHGWTHPLAETLVINENNLEFNDAEGRVVPFNIPSIGQNSINRAEQLQLKRLSTKAYILTSTVGHSRARYFDSEFGSDTLQLMQIRDPQGNQLRLNYKNNRLQRIQADFGDAWFFDYTTQGNLSAIHWRTAEGHQKTQAQYTYNDNDDLISATDAQGNREHYAYANHIITQRTLKSGYNFYFEWDGDTPEARCIRNWGDKINGKPTYDYRFKWDPANHRVAMSDTRGGITLYQFNDRGLPVVEKAPEGGETRYTYDARGNLTSQTDPLGHKEHFAYNENNTLRAYTNKQGESQHISRDAHGNITQVTDPLGQKWRSAYNKLGQLISQTNPLGDTHHYQYNDLGLVNSTAGPTGVGVRYIWDNQARLVAIGNPDGKHMRYRYNPDSQITHITWPDKKVTEYRYNANGQCTAIKDLEGKVSQFAYNPLGLLTHQEDNNKRRTEYQYNGLSQVVRRIDPAKQTLDYHYDGERNLIGLTNEKGENYQLGYDLNERLTQEIGFDGRVQRYQYNAAGQLITSEDLSKDGKNQISQIGYQRNNQGQLLQQIDAKNKQLINAFNYDKLGRLTDAKNTHQHLQWQYDEVGRVIEDKQGTQTLKHQYNSLGQRIASQLPNGDTVNYQFGDSGQFEGVSYNNETVTHITLDDMGRETQRQLSNQLVTDHSYDPQGRLQRQTTYKQNATSEKAKPQTAQLTAKLSDRQYHYNPQGQLSQIDDQLRGSTQYHYDALDRLTQVKGPNPESFVHDPAGNILSIETPDDNTNNKTQNKTQTTPQKGQIQGNRIAFQGDTHYQYDTKGNRIAQARGKNKKLKTYYKYNALNQLEAIDNNGKLTEYAYDPLGRRISKQSENSTTNFLWMEDVLLSETTEQDNNKQEKTYLFEPGTFKPLAFVQNKNVYHYHLDHLGTPQEISDANGNIVWAVSFKAYGNLAVAYENEIENNIRFQGQYFDEETGLHYNRFRYYDPGCGRFINQDPIGLAGGTNNYQYVPNPTGWVDPFGLTATKEDPSRQGKALKIPKNDIKAGPSKARLVLPAPTSLTPEMPDQLIESDILPKGFVFNQAVSPGQNAPGKFGTTDNITNVDYVRNELAVIPDFKEEISGVRQVRTTRPVRAQISTVGSQTQDGILYSGGGSQIDVLEYDRNNPFVEFIGDERPIN